MKTGLFAVLVTMLLAFILTACAADATEGQATMLNGPARVRACKIA